VKVRFGIGLGAKSGPDGLPAIVDRLETAGVDSLWYSELDYTNRSSAWHTRRREPAI
jgi:hypothetical protein